MDTLRDKNHARGAVGARQRAVEDVAMSAEFWRGKRVFVTGHTGFKGSWLVAVAAASWARGRRLRARAADTTPQLRASAASASGMQSRSRPTSATPRRLRDALAAHRPEVVFHLAAQSLVRPSYARAGRDLRDQRHRHGRTCSKRCAGSRRVRAVVIVTSDKCYENREWVWGYREDDPLGGHDPY